MSIKTVEAPASHVTAIFVLGEVDRESKRREMILRIRLYLWYPRRSGFGRIDICFLRDGVEVLAPSSRSSAFSQRLTLRATSGSRRTKRLPRPSSLVAEIEPPSRSELANAQPQAGPAKARVMECRVVERLE
jgi:hypothetical protein